MLVMQIIVGVLLGLCVASIVICKIIERKKR